MHWIKVGARFINLEYAISAERFAAGAPGHPMPKRSEEYTHVVTQVNFLVSGGANPVALYFFDEDADAVYWYFQERIGVVVISDERDKEPSKGETP